MTLKVCCMYYTDVFVGTKDNIDNLNNALKAVLKDSELTDDLKELNALASGLGFLAGLPACLCKTKKSVEEGLKKIYEELKTFNYCSNSKLNCDLCNSNDVPCKCCVIQSINKVKGCGCLQTPKKDCHCDGSDVSCSKVLAGLEACLHLQCLQADMNDICQCSGSECCKTGKCTQASGGSGGKSCDFCKKLQTQPTTGLGLSPPNPIRLAEKLETFFGDNSLKSSGCSCNGSPCTCCCLACQDNQCSESCNSECGSKCSHGSSQCPRKTFCEAIQNVKVVAHTSLMKCCNQGAKCHCQLQKSSSCTPNCCVSKSPARHNQQSLKCLLRRLVLYFKNLEISSVPSKPDFSQNCCEFLCVLKTCEFLRKFYNDKRNLNECKECKKKGCPKKGSCCAGSDPQCSTSTCSSCPECQQICNAKKFFNELETLRFAGPCGQDLWRTLDDFLNFICYVFYPRVKDIQSALQDLHNSKCKQCTPGSCQCSSNSSCPGCTETLKKLEDHKDVLSLMTRGYVSSYDPDKASWTSLTSSIPGSGSKCCGSLSPSCGCQSNCSSGSLCPDPSKCCPDCPQRKAAKIFLGMLPCMYWGLKILYDRCQDPVTWPDWQKISMDPNGIPSSGLAKFLQALGYDLDPLKSKKGSEFPPMLENLFSSGSLNSLFETSQKYFAKYVFTSDPSKPPPSTVRQMLLWLYGLRFHKHFSDLVSHCKDLCLPFGNSFHPDAFCYYIHTCSFILPVSVISVIQCPDGSPSFLPSHSDWQNFCYPEDPSELLEKLCEYVRKIYIPFNFLRFQCGRITEHAGWQECYFGQKCSLPNGNSSPQVSPSPSCSCSGHETYLCTWSSSNPSVHSNSCPSSGSSCNAKCPHPLMAFLIDGSSEDLQHLPTPFKSPEDFPKMGFKAESLISTGRDGYYLHGAIKYFCLDGFYPLTRLLQFSLCIFRNPPETLGELFAFFLRFSFSDVFKDFASYVDGEPGWYDGNLFAATVKNLYGSNSHSGNPHPFDLYSLHGCDGPKGSDATCGAYLHPLTFNAYNNNIFIKDFLDTYLSWVCYSAEKFEKKLKDFYNEASTKFKSCCSSGSSSKCPKIVKCPCALPFIYSWGFSFYAPKTLNCVDNEGTSKHKDENPQGGDHDKGDPQCTQKSCADFVAQLEKVLKENSPLLKLLSEIERFIWSIRLPFVYAFLYIWILVISYFYYVQFYKLDLLHIDSHLHLSRSFKILPSTLFSDASSKLKDLSYFTL
ncbi:variant erythrocyte surface antigen-1 family protein [Babesia divergens]|uniref:Variant erythrocyte surface antigen-1 family protein n=1 Tax=Babesia divergens TaxID=32595 RepID=A0AAD9LF96_BABDI|nr:variant erythrocyte surface antigen-1 family protein [Babesia divergens]